MTLNIELISQNSKSDIGNYIGTIIISNTSNITLTDWEIYLELINFNIINIDNLNLEKSISDGKKIIISPKEWKIHIEGNSQIISNFTYSGNHIFDYKIQDIVSQSLQEDINNEVSPPMPTYNTKTVNITVENNTDKVIIIKPGEKYTFTF